MSHLWPQVPAYSGPRIRFHPAHPSADQIESALAVERIASEHAVRNSLTALDLGDVTVEVADDLLPLLLARDARSHEAAGRALAATLALWIKQVAARRLGEEPEGDLGAAFRSAL